MKITITQLAIGTLWISTAYSVAGLVGAVIVGIIVVQDIHNSSLKAKRSL